MLADRGATIIDADVLAREAVRPESQALRDIVKRWGKDVLQQDGSLDREALRQIVFADQTELDVRGGDEDGARRAEQDRAPRRHPNAGSRGRAREGAW